MNEAGSWSRDRHASHFLLPSEALGGLQGGPWLLGARLPASRGLVLPAEVGVQAGGCWSIWRRLQPGSPPLKEPWCLHHHHGTVTEGAQSTAQKTPPAPSAVSFMAYIYFHI